MANLDIIASEMLPATTEEEIAVSCVVVRNA